MRSWRLLGSLLACVLSTLCGAGETSAQTRRAVIIGINRYAVTANPDRTRDLDGAVNDAQAMAESLRTYHKFSPSEIHVLLDQQATRVRILSEINDHLIAPARPGDVSLLFFAGHGSYRESPASRELDRRDETIVPADAEKGAADITDKELGQLLNRALDRKAKVIALFDSCHSGGITRGFSDEAKTRFVEPAQRATRESAAKGSATQAVAKNAAKQDEARAVSLDDAEVAIPPEERGAIVFAAAQDQQAAQERFVKGQPRGRFSSALQQVLNTASPDETAEAMFLRLRALMQAGGSQQEPVLSGSAERRKQTLWGQAPGDDRSAPRVAIGRVTASVLFLQAGFAIGLGPKATLQGTGDGASVKLEVVEVLGPATSKARVTSGSLGSVKPGDLFEVQSFGTSYLEPLRVFVATAPPRNVQAMVQLVNGLATARVIKLASDPTVEAVTHTVSWQRGQWLLRDATRRVQPLGSDPATTLRAQLANTGKPPLLFLSLPLPAEQLAALQLGAAGGGKSVETIADAAYADYLLVGRWDRAKGKAQYAWMMPGADKRLQGGLPLRTDWHTQGDEDFADKLADAALQLSRVKMFQTLDTPPEVSRFPYRLRLEKIGKQGFLAPGTQVKAGEKYRPVLVAAQTPQKVQPRYVYLFSLSHDGGSTLLVPGARRRPGENLIPDARTRGALPVLIPLTDEIEVTAPYGTDTLVLLSSATALPNPNVLQFAPVRNGTGVRDGCHHPLECLIFGIKHEPMRSQNSAPTDWSIDRVIVESVER